MQTRLVRLPGRIADDIASGIEIVDGDEHFAKSRLAEILREHLDIAAAHHWRGRPGLVRGASNEFPDRFNKYRGGFVRRQRRADQPPPRRAAQSSSRSIMTGSVRANDTSNTPNTTSSASTTARGTTVGRIGG